MSDYELLDSGELEKLERFGQFVLRRPDPQAIWKKALTQEAWSLADASFSNETKWKAKGDLPKEWPVEIGGFKFSLSISGFKHVGVFPEHEENWAWLSDQLRRKVGANKLRVLNLFGYTGGATLALAKAGAEVTHVDSSKISVEKASENAKQNGLGEAKIRWMVDDADGFLKKEIKRGNKYDGIVLDPPSFGKGAKGEVWKIEEGLGSLLEKCKEVLNQGGFLLLNGYAEGFSPDSYAQALSSVFQIPLDKIESGKLFIKEKTERGFILPAGIYARFDNKL